MKPGEIKVYDERILKDEELVKYKLNEGRDVEDDKYRRKNDMRKIIY